MNFKPGDKVCFSPDFFEGSKNELIEQCGTGVISSEGYTDPRPHPRLPPHLLPLPRTYYINIKWENIKEECWKHIDYLCLVEEREERDIYALFEQRMRE